MKDIKEMTTLELEALTDEQLDNMDDADVAYVFERAYGYNSKYLVVTLRELMDEEKYSLEMAPCQRNKCSKEPIQQSHVVSQACINGIGQIQANKKDGKVLLTIDGQQRLTTLIAFVSDQFKVDVKKSNVPFNENRAIDRQMKKRIDGKLFSELSERMQDKIMDRPISIELFDNMSEKSMSNLFIIKNTGCVPLNKMECTMAKATALVRDRIEKLAKDESFSNMKAPKQGNDRFQKEKMVLELFCIQREYAKQEVTNGKKPRDAFQDNIDLFIDELNNMSEEELDATIDEFLEEKKLYDNTGLFYQAKNIKAWNASTSPRYYFFDEKAIFNLFHDKAIDENGVVTETVNAIRDRANELYTQTSKKLEKKQASYRYVSGQGNDRISAMKKASALIYGEG